MMAPMPTSPQSVMSGIDGPKKTAVTPPTDPNPPSPDGGAVGSSRDTQRHGSGPASVRQTTAMSVVRLAFGPNADLYANVLQVSSFATDRDIRTAYFRRGRQVLNKPDDVAGVDNQESSAAIDDLIGASVADGARVGESSTVSRRAKLQFQAVSIAYEILSDPKLRREYDRTGAVPDDPVSKLSSTAPTQKLPQSRSERGPVKAKPSRPSRTRSKQGVRWNEHVEELVITNDVCADTDDVHDDDVDDDDRSVSSESTASSLLEHLRRLDEKTENFAKQAFFDSLEESMNSLIGAASSAMETEQEKQVGAEAKEKVAGENGKKKKTAARKRLFFDMSHMRKRREKHESSAEPATTGGVLPVEEDNKSNITPPGSDNDAALTAMGQRGEAVTPRHPKLLPHEGGIGATAGGAADQYAPDDEMSADTEDVAANDAAGSAQKTRDQATDLDKDEASTKKAEADDAAANFFIYLLTYLKGVAQEMKDAMEQMGRSCNNVSQSCADSFIIQEDELGSMIEILQAEIDHSPLGGKVDVVASLQGKKAAGATVAATAAS